MEGDGNGAIAHFSVQVSAIRVLKDVEMGHWTLETGITAASPSSLGT